MASLNELSRKISTRKLDSYDEERRLAARIKALERIQSENYSLFYTEFSLPDTQIVFDREDNELMATVLLKGISSEYIWDFLQAQIEVYTNLTPLEEYILGGYRKVNSDGLIVDIPYVEGEEVTLDGPIEVYRGSASLENQYSALIIYSPGDLLQVEGNNIIPAPTDTYRAVGQYTYRPVNPEIEGKLTVLLYEGNKIHEIASLPIYQEVDVIYESLSQGDNDAVAIVGPHESILGPPDYNVYIRHEEHYEELKGDFVDVEFGMLEGLRLMDGTTSWRKKLLNDIIKGRAVCRVIRGLDRYIQFKIDNKLNITNKQYIARSNIARSNIFDYENLGYQKVEILGSIYDSLRLINGREISLDVEYVSLFDKGQDVSQIINKRNSYDPDYHQYIWPMMLDNLDYSWIARNNQLMAANTDWLNYTYVYDEVINRGLRNSKISDRIYSMIMGMIDIIDASLPTNNELVLFRGISPFPGLSNAQVGDTFIEPGFQSKSFSYQVAKGFKGNAECCILLFRYSPGHKHIWLKPVKEPLSLVEGFVTELEFLTYPGEEFTIEKVEDIEVSSKKIRLLTCGILPTSIRNYEKRILNMIDHSIDIRFSRFITNIDSMLRPGMGIMINNLFFGYMLRPPAKLVGLRPTEWSPHDRHVYKEFHQGVSEITLYPEFQKGLDYFEKAAIKEVLITYNPGCEVYPYPAFPSIDLLYDVNVSQLKDLKGNVIPRPLAIKYTIEELTR